MTPLFFNRIVNSVYFLYLRRGLSTLLRSFLLVALICCLAFTGIPLAYAQEAPTLLRQDRDRSPVQPMTPEDLAQLNDPLFNLVLKDHADAKTLDAVTQQLQPDGQSVFAVHEKIVDESQSGANRRAVVTLRGKTDGQQLNQDVMFSVGFNPNAFPAGDDIEAVAWDDQNSQFNYYKLNRTQGETEPTWKFRGNSKDADLLSSSARQGTCMACHINGGLVMKELLPPWNNWHSIDFDASYLRPNTPNNWPIADAPDSPFQDLRGARILESNVISANRRFNDRRIQSLAGDGTSGRTVTDVKQLLKPLFVTTEFNLISSGARSSSHPFDRRSTSQTVSIPTSFFLNSSLLARSLNVEAFDFGQFVQLSADEYQDLIARSDTRLNNETPGDANFAWFAPEASDIDNTYVQTLIQKNIVPREFVAAVMSVDLETPVLSGDRARLWEANNILPSQFRIGPNNDLIAQTISNLERLNPASDSPEGQFLAALRSSDPIERLQNQVNDYIERMREQFETPQLRPDAIAHLYRQLLERREAILADADLSHLDETNNLLLPVGDISKLPDGFPALPDRPTLVRGDQGDAVETLQQLLAQLGFLNGPIDGDFGPGTEQAVLAAQRSFGLVGDGIVGPATWAALDEAANQPPVDLPTLRIGAQGDAVVRLQQLLRAQGFLFSPADGDFGPLTQAAVIRAQRQFGLDPDGIVGPLTWSALGA